MGQFSAEKPRGAPGSVLSGNQHRNHLTMSGGSPKHVKFSHATLLLSAKPFGSGSRVRALVNSPSFQTVTLPTLSMK
jgi:hypothetical protein